MKKLFFIAVILGGLYAGYWFVGSSQVETRARAALAELQAQGWQVDYESLDTATAGDPKLRTSQIALPADVCDAVYAHAEGYEQSQANVSQDQSSEGASGT